MAIRGSSLDLDGAFRAPRAPGAPVRGRSAGRARSWALGLGADEVGRREPAPDRPPALVPALDAHYGSAMGAP